MMKVLRNIMERLRAFLPSGGASEKVGSAINAAAPLIVLVETGQAIITAKRLYEHRWREWQAEIVCGVAPLLEQRLGMCERELGESALGAGEAEETEAADSEKASILSNEPVKLFLPLAFEQPFDLVSDPAQGELESESVSSSSSHSDFEATNRSNDPSFRIPLFLRSYNAGRCLPRLVRPLSSQDGILYFLWVYVPVIALREAKRGRIPVFPSGWRHSLRRLVDEFIPAEELKWAYYKNFVIAPSILSGSSS